ncbi:FAS1-like dehydratase domain-containing protein [Actinophytocola sp.]|uniref:FAS1-like dehydratase domain-containing protein n=1 Tax=Actinophytocola sp. TaxID=1872138 RepID=UPI002D589BEA|nr:MaoC family dehydratase N-terminal domain-containing protein [Actinophytocola sp.]HYQ69995.1 MaoC family dehydratase N-terminal domain-containing protein [Actinophytocola sp.]
MPLDPAFVGHAYPRSEVYEVSRAKIREFAEAIGDDNPVYRDAAAARAAGHPDLIAPPTFGTVLFSRHSIEDIVNDEKLGVDYGRLVHGDMKFVFARPVRAGDRLTVTTHITEIDNRMGNDFLSLRAEIDTDEGERVVTALSQLVIRAEDE